MSKYGNKEASGRFQHLSHVVHITQADVSPEKLNIIDAKEKLTAGAFEKLKVTTMASTQYLTL